MSLNTQMKALKHAVEAGALPSVVGAFRRAEMALRQSGIPERAIYAATKTGVLALVRTGVPKLKGKEVTVNMLSLGATTTRIIHG